MKHGTLHIVGTPLDDGAELSPAAYARIESCSVVIGESRKGLFPYLKALGREPEKRRIFLLDPPRPEEWQAIRAALGAVAKSGGDAALLSDTGMPILFDPGNEVLALARELKLEIRATPSATSWGTACAVSGFPPPFFIEGFLPRETPDRLARLRELARVPAASVFMDTPYRFRILLRQLNEVFGPERQAFLAWEISSAQEAYIWGSLASIEKEAERRNLQKGEFILLTAKP